MKRFKTGLAIVALVVAASGTALVTAAPQAVAASKKSNVKTSKSKKGTKNVSGLDLGSGR